MAFISISEELAKKSFTTIENRFITKYMPILDPAAIKVYLYSLYIHQSGLTSYTLDDLAKSLSMTTEEIIGHYEYLEEYELVSIISLIPTEVKILEADNLYGSPKKIKPEKYADFSKNIQNVIKGRMISTSEFREYFLMIEEYGFEQNALIMIINYCVNLKGDNIRSQYIKKVVKSFAEDNITTTEKVDKKLSAYFSSTTSLLKIFSAAGINRQPDIEDDKLYKKWTVELGFDDNTICTTVKLFKIKNCEKLDNTLCELYKNKKFDVKEIEDYAKNKNSVLTATYDIAKSLGVYLENALPYVENYVNVWCDYGYSLDCLKEIAAHCFKHGKRSFEDMQTFIAKLFSDGCVSDNVVKNKLNELNLQEEFIKTLLSRCGLTRKIIEWDKENLARWKSWNFSDEMLLEGAALSLGKSNPIAYLNGILSTWKAEGIFSVDMIKRQTSATSNSNSHHEQKNNQVDMATIEQHYTDLRNQAEYRAELALSKATADPTYKKLDNEINELSMKLALAKVRNESCASQLEDSIKKLNNSKDLRLKELKLNKNDFLPRYSCKICNDTGYTKEGRPCDCMIKFIESLN